MWKHAVLVLALLAGTSALAGEDAAGLIPGSLVNGLEKGILKYTNDHRATAGAPPLREDQAAMQMARDYSLEMVLTGNFSHTKKDGTNYEQRLAQRSLCGGPCPESAENIYQVKYSGLEHLIDSTRSDDQVDSLAKEIVDGWIASPDHRRNIEDPLLEEFGVGVAISKDGALYATQDFLRRNPLDEEQYQAMQQIPHTEGLTPPPGKSLGAQRPDPASQQ